MKARWFIRGCNSEEGKIISYHFKDKFKSSHGLMAADINTLWIDPEFRKKGIMKELKLPSERWARQDLAIKKWLFWTWFMLLIRTTPCSNVSLSKHNTTKREHMSLSTILLIVLILILVGAFPSWPHSKNWGYGPSGGLGLVVLILVVLLLMGRI